MGKRKERNEVLVINYHCIDNGEPGVFSKSNTVFVVKKHNFEQQIKCIVENRIPVVSVDDIVDNQVNTRFSIAITVDDGNISDYETILPDLKSNNLTATFFLLYNPETALLNPEFVREMISQGFSVGSHGIRHHNMLNLSSVVQKDEFVTSKSGLEEIVNHQITGFAFPFGCYNEKLVKMAADAGYNAVYSTNMRLNYPDQHPYVIHRWSVKRSTSVREFEKIILNRKYRYTQMVLAGIRHFIKKIVGNAVSGWLNRIIHPNWK